jgi:GDP-L-fucose synthase
LHNAKINNLKEYTIWGSGKPKREFLYVDDLAKIILKLLKIDNLPDWINVGSDEELNILELAKKIACIIGYTGEIKTQNNVMDGTPRKKLDCSLLKSLITYNQITLDQGLPLCYSDFLNRNFN